MTRTATWRWRGLSATVLLASVLTASPTTQGMSPAAAATGGEGYWLVAADGGVFNFGSAGFRGSTGGIVLNEPVVALAPDGASQGADYWLIASDGGVFTFDALPPFYGSLGAIRLNAPVVGAAYAPTDGYWLVAADGGVFSFGNARFSGSAGGLPLNAPVTGMVPTPTGAGYWLVAADGGVLTFGDAPFLGSAVGMPVRAPVVGIAAHPDGAGYWLVAADGSVYAFGSARTPGPPDEVRSRIVGIAATSRGDGYWLAGADGSVYALGGAPSLGSAAGLRLNWPIVGITAKPDGFVDAQSRQAGQYGESGDYNLLVTFHDGRVDSWVNIDNLDCTCSERLAMSLGVEGDGADYSQRFVVRLTNTSGVRMVLPGGLRVTLDLRPAGTGETVATLIAADPGVTSLAPRAWARISVPVPTQYEGNYEVDAFTTVVLE